MTRGRKRKQGKREPNGRLSRQPEHRTQRLNEAADAAERETMSVALEARQRVLLNDDFMQVFGDHRPQRSVLARDQKAGTAIGRYCLQGLVTAAQYDAAIMFLEARARNLRAIDAPPQPGAVDLNATHGRPVTLENPALLRKWRADYKAACDAIQEKQNEIRLQGNLYGSLYAVLVNDVMLDTLLGDVRTALNALVKHYRLLAVAA